MRKRRFSEEERVPILREANTGRAVKELGWRHAMSDATFSIWRREYGGLGVSDAKRLRTLEDEKKCLKKLLAETVLENGAIKDVLGKNGNA